MRTYRVQQTITATAIIRAPTEAAARDYAGLITVTTLPRPNGKSYSGLRRVVELDFRSDTTEADTEIEELDEAESEEWNAQ